MMSGGSLLRVSVSDGDLAYIYDGANAAPARAALVFLHGWTLDHRMWRPQIGTLSNRPLVMAPDRRGFGASTAPPDLAQEPIDVVRLLDLHQVERAIIVGMSQAGRVAIDFALRFPERLAGLVLQGAPLGEVPAEEAAEAIPVAEYAALVRAGRLAEMKARWRAHPLMRTQNEAARTLIEDIFADYNGRDLLAPAPPPRERVQDLSSITAPALVLTGANDTAHRRRSGAQFAAALGDARYVEIPDAGHLCNLCQPDAYADALSHFMRHVEPGTAD
jgi:pimeloyl-ACP methyl ester carboxylesterase